uniref:Uncharacterized protein n=1 Tax=Anguilla anguilla TaxID=7936 RepID=A0A0E9UJD8_ANGAN
MLTFSSFPSSVHYGATVHHQSIRGHLVVEFESLLYRGDGSQHRKPVDSALDVGGCAKLIRQHLGNSRNLVFLEGMIREIILVPFPRAPRDF